MYLFQIVRCNQKRPYGSLIRASGCVWVKHFFMGLGEHMLPLCEWGQRSSSRDHQRSMTSGSQNYEIGFFFNFCFSKKKESHTFPIFFFFYFFPIFLFQYFVFNLYFSNILYFNFQKKSSFFPKICLQYFFLQYLFIFSFFKYLFIFFFKYFFLQYFQF